MKNKQKYFIIGFNFLIILGFIFSCKNVDPASRYAEAYKHKTYEYIIKNNESFTTKSLKNDVNNLKNKISELKKKNNNSRRIESLEKTLIKLRKEIEELENN